MPFSVNENSIVWIFNDADGHESRIRLPIHITLGYTARLRRNTLELLKTKSTTSVDVCDENGDGCEGTLSWSPDDQTVALQLYYSVSSFRIVFGSHVYKQLQNDLDDIRQ